MPPAIDFLHPRRPPPPVRSKRPLVLAGAAAGLLLLLGGIVLFQLWSLGRQIDQLKSQGADRDNLAPKLAEAEKQLEPYRAWQASDINWLAALAELSAQLPDPEQIIFTQVSARSNEFAGRALRDTGRKAAKAKNKSAEAAQVTAAEIEVAGLATSRDVVREAMRVAESSQWIPSALVFVDDPTQQKYKVSFSTTLRRGPRDVLKEPVELPPELVSKEKEKTGATAE